jgi:inorganic triphosphatase YgiF
MGVSLEVELKYRAATEAALDLLALAIGIGPAQLGPTREANEIDRYLDTADGRLSAVLWACRLRTRDGATVVSLKGPPDTGTAGALHRRPELEGPATDELDPARWPPSPARDALLAMSGGEPLAERLALHQVRRERAVHVDGSHIGTLSLDSVSVRREGAERGAFPVVELELNDGAVASGLDVAPLAAALAAVPGLAQDEHTKLERALELLDDRRP